MIGPHETPMTLESPVRVPDGGGGYALSWQPDGVLWATVTPRDATERAAGDRLASRISHRIEIRREPGTARRPRPDQRLRNGERVFAILGVAEASPRSPTVTVWAMEGPFS